MHVNKVHHVKTISRVARELGENEDWLFDVAIEMEPEDGVIWVYGVGDEGVMAFLSAPGVQKLPCVLETPGENREGPSRAEVELARTLRERGLAARR